MKAGQILHRKISSTIPLLWEVFENPCSRTLRHKRFEGDARPASARDTAGSMRGLREHLARQRHFRGGGSVCCLPLPFMWIAHRQTAADPSPSTPVSSQRSPSVRKDPELWFRGDVHRDLERIRPIIVPCARETQKLIDQFAVALRESQLS